ncbi:MAG: hypothetical protein ACUVSF_14040, partial [Anaerolineae bacterium]
PRRAEAQGRLRSESRLGWGMDHTRIARASFNRGIHPAAPTPVRGCRLTVSDISDAPVRP